MRQMSKMAILWVSMSLVSSTGNLKQRYVYLCNVRTPDMSVFLCFSRPVDIMSHNYISFLGTKQ